MKAIDLPLLGKTSSQWVQTVLGDFETFLRDHAACERKAAALAMSFIAKYSDRAALVEPMVCLAREELEHFHQVYRIMHRRKISLAVADEKDPYINDIIGQLRHGREQRFLDRLIMSGIVEARGYERFGLLSEALEDLELKKFYRDLADREAGHYKIFENIAQFYFSEAEVEEAISRIAKIECQAMENAPLRPVLH